MRIESVRRLGTTLALVVLWLEAFGLGLNLEIRNDHFGRISPGRQILAFGELPFRDFLDPGYFLTEFSSAAVQWLFGDNLFGEVLLTSLFIATGCLLVAVLARRVTGRVVPALIAGALALLALPRAYDYDKVLFYPLGLWLAWRWFERPSRGRLLALSVGLVGAALYRYDNGVFIGIAVFAGIAAQCGRDRHRFTRLAGALLITVAIVSAPALLFLQMYGGVANAFDQALSYAIREGARTRVTSLPRIRVGQRLVASIAPPPSQNHVQVRWAAAVASPEQRQQHTARLGLDDEQPQGAPEDRTFAYTVSDPSVERLRLIVNDPLIEDTGGINRGELTLVRRESMLVRLQRTSALLRLRLLPDSWTPENASAVLFYVLLAVPLAGVGFLSARWKQQTELRRAELAATIVLCLLLDAFILREPISARVGGMAGPLCVLAVWVVVQVGKSHQRSGAPVRRGAVLITCSVVVLLALWSLATSQEWLRLALPLAHPRELQVRLRQLRQTPTRLDQLPTGRLEGMVRYVHACTRPDQRVFASWFVPELYFFAQRGFGGGIAATFGDHWSEPRFERRSIAAFEAHSTPILIFLNAGYDDFRRAYPLLDVYFGEHYTLAGTTDFGDRDVGRDAYRVLVRADVAQTGVDQRWALPCFGGAGSL
jgi:hypothetical protein